MATKPSLLTGHPNCNEALPVGEVVETYDFHQFAKLRIEKGGKVKDVGIPAHIANREYLSFLQDAGYDSPTLIADLDKSFVPLSGNWPAVATSASVSPQRIEIDDVANVLSKGEFALGTKRYSLAGLGDVGDRLREGLSIRGNFVDNNGDAADLELVPLLASKCDLPKRITLLPDDLAGDVLSRGVAIEGLGAVKLRLSAAERKSAIRDGWVKTMVAIPGSSTREEVLIELAQPMTTRSAMSVVDERARSSALIGDTIGKRERYAEDAAETLTRKVMVHIPIEQEWRLLGYSRGLMVNTFALAPQEQLTLEVYSWDRRKRTSETTSSLEQENTSESIATQKITREALREAKDTSGWNFGANLSFSVPQIGMTVGSNFSTNQTTENTKRSTIQAINEATLKASTRIKSSFQTKVTEAAEYGREDKSTRRIVNPNTGRILNFDAFEVLARFEVTTRYRFDKATLCVLYPCVDFLASLSNPETKVRCHALLALEGMIYQLVPERMRPGFDAARLFLAWDKICEYSCDAACTCATHDKPGSMAAAASGNPYESDALAALAQLRDVIGKLNNASGRPLSRRVGIPAERPGYLACDTQTQSDLRRDWQAYLYRQVVLEKVASPFWNICNDFVRQSENNMDWAGRVVRAADPQVANFMNGAVAYGSLSTQIAAFLAEQVIKFGANLPFMVPYVGFDSMGLEPTFSALKSAYNSWKDAEDARKQPPAPPAGDAAKPAEPPPAPRRSNDAAYSPEALAKAAVEVDALSLYLTMNKSLYRSAIWNALNATDRLRFLGIFGSVITFGTPRVLDFVGDEIAVELNAETFPGADDFMAVLKKMDNASDKTEVSLPVPGVTLQARLDGCDLLEPYLLQSRENDLRRQSALASQAEFEAKRFDARLGKDMFEDPIDRRPKLEIEQSPMTPP